MLKRRIVHHRFPQCTLVFVREVDVCEDNVAVRTFAGPLGEVVERALQFALQTRDRLRATLGKDVALFELKDVDTRAEIRRGIRKTASRQCCLKFRVDALVLHVHTFREGRYRFERLAGAQPRPRCIARRSARA